MDLLMPGMDGLEVCRRLRAGGNIPILMLTAKDTIQDRVEGLDAGSDDYLVKPFHLRYHTISYPMRLSACLLHPFGNHHAVRFFRMLYGYFRDLLFIVAPDQEAAFWLTLKLFQFFCHGLRLPSCAILFP
jgi:CheY-like chemotaxis protein